MYPFLLPIASCLYVDFKKDQNTIVLKIQKYFGKIYWTSNGRAGGVHKRRQFAGGKMKCSKYKTLRLCWDLSMLRSSEKSGQFLSSSLMLSIQLRKCCCRNMPDTPTAALCEGTPGSMRWAQWGAGSLSLLMPIVKCGCPKCVKALQWIGSVPKPVCNYSLRELGLKSQVPGKAKSLFKVLVQSNLFHVRQLWLVLHIP